MTKNVMETLSEARFWVTLVGAFVVTQGGVAFIVPEIAEATTAAAAKATKKRTGTAVANVAKAINDHANHIEELRLKAAEQQRLWVDERDVLKKQVGELDALVVALLDAVAGKHGQAYLSRYVDRIDDRPPRLVDIEPVARLLEDEPIRRLPTSFEELQEDEAQ